MTLWVFLMVSASGAWGSGAYGSARSAAQALFKSAPSVRDLSPSLVAGFGGDKPPEPSLQDPPTMGHLREISAVAWTACGSIFWVQNRTPN